MSTKFIDSAKTEIRDAVDPKVLSGSVVICCSPVSQGKFQIINFNFPWKKSILGLDWMTSLFSDPLSYKRFTHFKISSQWSSLSLVSVTVLIYLSVITYWCIVYSSYFTSSSYGSASSLYFLEILLLSFFSFLFCIVLLGIICYYRISIPITDQYSKYRVAFIWMESVSLICIVVSTGLVLLFHSFRYCVSGSSFRVLLCSSTEMSNHLSISLSLVLLFLPSLLARAFSFVSFSVVLLSFMISLVFVFVCLSLKNDSSDISWVMVAVCISFWTLLDFQLQSLSYFSHSLDKTSHTSSSTLSYGSSLDNHLKKVASDFGMNLSTELKPVSPKSFLFLFTNWFLVDFFLFTVSISSK
jgi:hypothetical protein